MGSSPFPEHKRSSAAPSKARCRTQEEAFSMTRMCRHCGAIHYHKLDCPTGRYRVTERDFRRTSYHSGAIGGAIVGAVLDGGVGLIAGLLLGSTLDD